MGLEARCEAHHRGRTSGGDARLERDALYFRGDFELKLRFAEMKTVDARRGVLRIATVEGVTRLKLGAAAETWALKIRYPRSLIDKLGVAPGARVSVLKVDDAAFWEQLEARTDDVGRGRVRKDSDVIVYGLSRPRDLPRLAALREKIKPAGCIWAVWPKGRKEFREDDVRCYALSHGLVDVKVVSFSETLSGLKLMIPRKLR